MTEQKRAKIICLTESQDLRSNDVTIDPGSPRTCFFSRVAEWHFKSKTVLEQMPVRYLPWTISCRFCRSRGELFVFWLWLRVLTHMRFRRTFITLTDTDTLCQSGRRKRRNNNRYISRGLTGGAVPNPGRSLPRECEQPVSWCMVRARAFCRTTRGRSSRFPNVQTSRQQRSQPRVLPKTSESYLTVWRAARMTLKSHV